MGMSIKDASDRLIKIAEAMEREALEHTYFVCDECNHTANLATINQRRKQAAEKYEIKDFDTITVNDSVRCPVEACEGMMLYVPTSESSKFYVEADDEEEDVSLEETPETEDIEEEKKKETPEGEEVSEEEVSEEPPVEETPSEEAPAEETPTEEPSTEKPPADEPPVEEGPSEEGPSEEAPSEEMTPPEDLFEPVEEESEMAEVEEEPEKPKKKPKKDKPDDSKASFPKKDVPKFEKKEAEDAFWESVSRYTV